MRQAARRLLERTLRLAVRTPRRTAGRSLILAYHNVVPDDAQGLGDRSLHLPLSSFLRQLDLLQTHCQVRPLAELLTEGPFTNGPHVAITFDDAYRGAVELALPELSRRGLPSTLFVAPGLLGAPSFWWDELAAGGGLSDAARRQALEHHAGRHPEIRAGMPGGPPRLPEWYGCASDEQVRACGAHRQVTLGAHSWSHPNLARLGAEQLALELSRPLGWLRDAAVATLPVLAYPYGLSTPAVERAAEQAGYAAGLRVEGGWFSPRTDRAWAIPRYNVPAGLSDDGLMLRLSGHFRV